MMTAQEFNEKVVPLNRQLYRYAFRYLENQEDSKDAVQDIFVKLWNLRSELVTVNSIEAFSIRVMRNYCLDRIKLRKTVSLDVNEYFSNRPGNEPAPDRHLEVNNSVDIVRNAITDMQEPQRSVVRMRDIEGYSNEEIAEALGIADGTVRVILSRGRNKIRQILAKMYGYENERSKNLIAEIL
ncbi:MAG: RNA polymerase sigma factor [Porphyromonadaceae bacterium]|nr:MAG: RNA polymerase sigma factor [Porphyromonadaceae bacterium]